MYIGFEGFDANNGTNHLIVKLLEELSLNNNVHYINSNSGGCNDDIPSELRNIQSFTYNIIKRKKIAKNRFAKRYLYGIPYSIKAALLAKKHKKKTDIIILQSTPTAFFTAVFLKVFVRKKIVFNSFDVFPDGITVLEKKRFLLITFILKKMQGILYNSCYKIVVNSPDVKQKLIRKGVSEWKLEIIYNWYNEENLKYIDYKNNKFAKKYNLSNKKFYVQYAGNFGNTFDYKKVIEVASDLVGFKNIEFQMVGEGSYLEEFVDVAKDKGLENIKFYPWQPADIVSDVYSICDIGLIPLEKNVIFNSYPSKSSLLMACGKPIVFSVEEESEFCKMINSNNLGYCFSRTMKNEISKKIIELYEDRMKIHEVGRNTEKYAKDFFSSGVNIEKYKNIITKGD